MITTASESVYCTIKHRIVVWVVWLRRAMGKHGRFENLESAHHFRIESNRNGRFEFESRSFAGPYYFLSSSWAHHSRMQYSHCCNKTLSLSSFLSFPVSVFSVVSSTVSHVTTSNLIIFSVLSDSQDHKTLNQAQKISTITLAHHDH